MTHTGDVAAGDVVRTELRLVLCYRGWEYTVLKRETTHSDPGQEQTIRVMVSGVPLHAVVAVS